MISLLWSYPLKKWIRKTKTRGKKVFLDKCKTFFFIFWHKKFHGEHVLLLGFFINTYVSDEPIVAVP